MTQEQENFVINNYLSMQNKEIAQKLGLHINTIKKFLKIHKLTRRTTLNLTDEQKQLLIDNYMDMAYADLGKLCGLSAKQVEGWLRNHVKNKQSKRRIFDKEYFHNIDTPDRAYWLGFIYADGWIVCNQSGRNYELGMELQRTDRYILEKLNDCLGGQHIVDDSDRTMYICSNTRLSHSQTSFIRIYSKDIVEDLHSHGIDFRKSHSDMYPTVCDNLFPDFLRGYIDGDGCIHSYNNGNLAVHITSANKYGLIYVQQKLRDLYNIDSRIYEENVDGYCTKYRLYCFRKTDVKRLLDIIYYDKNSIKLDRKYQKYINYYGLAA